MSFKRYLFVISSLLYIGLFSLLSAQAVSISVLDAAKAPLIGATVQLLRIVDSVETANTTDLDGKAAFPNLRPDLYQVSIRYIGYESLEKSITIKTGRETFTYQLREDAVTLGEVTVKARRPLIRQEDDKMIIDPEPLANISTNTLEVLEKTPGVFVDQDGGIYLNSATPAIVYINGREQRMSARDVATILQSLPPGSVQRIEVLRTPSTKYDAASSGGIVNVVLKKGVRLGRTGAINMGFNQGVYGNRFAGFNLNDSGDKSAYYLNVNYNHSDYLEEINTTRVLSPDSMLRQTANSRPPANRGYLGYGLSYDPSDKLSFSYDGRLSGNWRNNTNNSVNRIETGENVALSNNLNRTEDDDRFANLQQDLGFVYKIDTLGSEWDTKFNYSYSDNDGSQTYRSDFLSPINAYIAGSGENQQQRHFFLFQSDLTRLLSRPELKIETGIKATWQDYRSEADFLIDLNGAQRPDTLRTNAFRYRERLSAAYFQASRRLPGNFLLKAGVRVEHTYMRGEQTIPQPASFLIDRLDWFPYVYVSRPLMKIASYPLQGFLIYRRTISRPGYQSLNPYVRYIDQYLYEVGNPALKPQFTDNFEANVSFNDMPVFAVGRNNTRDIFTSVVYPDAQFPEVAVRTYDNLGQSAETYFRLVGAIPPGGKYFFVVSAQYNLNAYEGLYEGRPLSFSRGSWRFFTFHSLSLGENTKLTLNGFMALRGLQNFYELDTFGQLNFGLNQTFLGKRLSITLNARDVLRTMATRFTIQQGSVLIMGDRYNDDQRFGINLRYNLGIAKKEEQSMFPPVE